MLSYGEMLERIAEAMLVGRPALRLGVNLTGLAGRSPRRSPPRTRSWWCR